jgi:hypothetical protein
MNQPTSVVEFKRRLDRANDELHPWENPPTTLSSGPEDQEQGVAGESTESRAEVHAAFAESEHGRGQSDW